MVLWFCRKILKVFGRRVCVFFSFLVVVGYFRFSIRDK